MDFKVLITLFVLITTLFISWSQAQQQNYPIRIISILDEPYLTLKRSEQPLTGNARYEGFAADLAEIFAKSLNFSYTISLVKDGKYGTVSKDGVWDGIIGELVRSNADIAIAPLTMTAQRAEVVDFSTPIMDFQLRIAMKKGEGQGQDEVNDPGSFMFLRPFSAVLWTVTVLSIVILVLLLYTIELYVPRRQNQTGGQGEVKFCPNGVCGSPRTVSGRLLQVLFWIFVVAVVAAYIAAFSGDRIVDRLGKSVEDKGPIRSIEDLGGQTQVKYGVIRGGSTYTYFRNSLERLHRRMFGMIARESVANSAEGFRKVRNDSAFAFIGEAPYAEYLASKQPCDIVLAPESFGPQKFFAVATRNSVLDSNLKKIRDGINVIILRMRESEEMENLRKKWFVGDDSCPLSKKSDEVRTERQFDNALCLYDLAGIFYCLIAGIFVAIVFAGLEIWGRRPIAPRRAGGVELHVPLHTGQDRPKATNSY